MALFRLSVLMFAEDRAEVFRRSGEVLSLASEDGLCDSDVTEITSCDELAPEQLRSHPYQIDDDEPCTVKEYFAFKAQEADDA